MSAVTQLLTVAPFWAAVSITALTHHNCSGHCRLLAGMSMWASGIYLGGLFVQIARFP